MATILVLHRPTLNLLGQREPGIYGAQTLESINRQLADDRQAEGHHLLCLQSDAEHEPVRRIHYAERVRVGLIMFNPAAITHTSLALRDAVLAVNIPSIDVHLSNVHAREAFRQHSYFSAIARGVICGFGANSYRLAWRAALTYLSDGTSSN